MTRLFPVEAAQNAAAVDRIFWGLMALSGAILFVVFGLIWVFAIRYRRGSKADRGPLPAVVSREFEIGWTAGALFLALFLFWWAASANLGALVPPKDALEIHVVGKQWMWKIEHPSGAREINALHAPVGVPVKLIMTSQDTIHDFYVPAFRMKQDVLPGRYTQEWFTATKPGQYRIECAEYCGTDHALMGGVVTVMPRAEYAKWTAEQPQAGAPAVRGAALFSRLGCGGCHGAGAPAAGLQGPSLYGLYGSRVRLSDGREVTADETYLHRSIVEPDVVRVQGWPAAMPSYANAVGEEELVDLIAYLRTLKPGLDPPTATRVAASPQQPQPQPTPQPKPPHTATGKPA